MRQLSSWNVKAGALLLAIGFSVSALPGTAFAQKRELFSDAAVAGEPDSADQAVKRSRFVRLNVAALAGAALAQGQGRADAAVVDLNFFPDASLRASIDRVEKRADHSVFYGKVDGDEGELVLVVQNGVVAASLRGGGKLYQIRYAGGNVHEVQEVDPGLLPPDGEPLAPEDEPAPDAAAAEADSSSEADVEVAADDGTQIDVLVAYTPAARAAAGGVAAIQALINLGISETNQAYANAGVIQRVRLVHTVEQAYVESGDMGLDLSRLRAPADGFMDGVHALRNTHGADLVHLLVNSGDYCGIAYVMNTVGAAFESSAFGVTLRTCVSPNLTFAHEMGHNMGLHHDRYMTTTNSPYPYSHGYVNQAALLAGAPANKRWRTIMAYNDECSAAGFSCTKLMYFSNPAKFYTGDPMGVPGLATSASTDGPANERLSLDNTRVTVANFRQTASIPGIPSLSIGDASVSEGHSGTTNATFTVGLSAAASTSVAVNYSTANGTAASSSDYTATSSSLTFAPGQTSKTLTVAIAGDTAIEGDETFLVNLSGATSATIADGQGVGTIRNDDSPALSIGDVAVAEGNSGTATAKFNVTLSAASASSVTVSYSTANRTAVAPSDYASLAGSLTFTPGQTSKTISVSVVGDTVAEANETFLVNLLSPVSAATIADGQGVGTITNDDSQTTPPGGQPVSWTFAIGVSVSGNSLTKSAATGWGNAGAVSSMQIASGNGYVEVTASETSTYRMIGLSNGNSNASWEDIDFAAYLAQQGQLKVYEAGTLKGTFGTYVGGDKIRVAVAGSSVTYSRNGVVFYTSTRAIVYPLLVDTALYSQNATLSSVVCSGCSVPTSTAQPVSWTSAVGVSVSGNFLTKSAATGWGNAGAVSTMQIASGNGYVEVTASETSTYRMIGLSNGNSNASWEDIDFAAYLAQQGQLKVYEAGTLKGTFGTYVGGDKIRVAVAGSLVTYSRNGVVFYTSTRAIVYPLLVDTALHNQGATVSNVVCSGCSVPTPTAQPVSWTSAVGVSASASSLTKTAPHGWGNAGAVSSQQIAAGEGYVEVTASETSTYRMIGLSNGNSNATWEDIDFAVCLAQQGQLMVYEAGTLKGSFGSYLPGDKIRVAVVGPSVKYSRNGVVFYTSTRAIVYPLLVDTALYNQSATLSSVVIAGGG